MSNIVHHYLYMCCTSCMCYRWCASPRSRTPFLFSVVLSLFSSVCYCSLDVSPHLSLRCMLRWMTCSVLVMCAMSFCLKRPTWIGLAHLPRYRYEVWIHQRYGLRSQAWNAIAQTWRLRAIIGFDYCVPEFEKKKISRGCLDLMSPKPNSILCYPPFERSLVLACRRTTRRLWQSVSVRSIDPFSSVRRCWHISAVFSSAKASPPRVLSIKSRIQTVIVLIFWRLVLK